MENLGVAFVAGAFFGVLIAKYFVMMLKKTKQLKTKNEKYLEFGMQGGKTWSLACYVAGELMRKNIHTLMYRSANQKNLNHFLIGFKKAMLEIYEMEEEKDYIIEAKGKENCYLIFMELRGNK